MSNVHKKERSQHRLTVLDKALDVYDHTTNLLANEKVFKRTYAGLIDRIDNEATMIYHCCRVANEELDTRIADEARMRILLQKEAISHCQWLKTYIMLAAKKISSSRKTGHILDGSYKGRHDIYHRMESLRSEKLQRKPWAVGC